MFGKGTTDVSDMGLVGGVWVTGGEELSIECETCSLGQKLMAGFYFVMVRDIVMSGAFF